MRFASIMLTLIVICLSPASSSWSLAQEPKLQATLHGHTGEVWAVAFSADGKTLASGSTDSTVKLWEVGPGKVRTTIKDTRDAIESVALSPDGKTLGIGTGNYSRLWDLQTGQERVRLKGTALGSNARSIAFSPDGKIFAVGGFPPWISLWDVATGKLLRTLQYGDQILSVAFSPDGKSLAAGSFLNIKLWDVATGKEKTPKFQREDGARSLLFLPDGKLLTTGGSESIGKIRLVDLAKNKSLILGEEEAEIRSIALARDGKLLASASEDGVVRLWDVANRKVKHILKGHQGMVRSVAFSPDGKLLASAGDDMMVKLWDLTGKTANPVAEPKTELVHFLKREDDWYKQLAITRDGKTLAAASSGVQEAIEIWDLPTRRHQATLKGHSQTIWSLAFSPDGKSLITGSADHSAKLWELPAGKEKATLKGHKGDVRAVAFSPDGKTVATGSYDTSIKLWDTATGKELGEFKGHRDQIRCLAFSGDGKFLASGSADRSAKVWDLASGKEKPTRIGHAGVVNCLMFSPDSSLLLTGGDDSIVQLWNVASGKRRLSFEAKLHVQCMDITSDAKIGAFGSGQTVQLWDLDANKEIVTLGHPGEVGSVAFTPDTKTLAVACSFFRPIKLWSVPTVRKMK
jgi:WD40 repeat protein